MKWFSWRCSANNLNVSGNNALIVSYRGISWAHEMPLTGKGGVVRETKIIMVPTLTYGARWVHYEIQSKFPPSSANRKDWINNGLFLKTFLEI